MEIMSLFSLDFILIIHHPNHTNHKKYFIYTDVQDCSRNLKNNFGMGNFGAMVDILEQLVTALLQK